MWTWAAAPGALKGPFLLSRRCPNPNLTIRFATIFVAVRRRFILLKARREPECNFLGLDIRAKLVDRSNLWSGEVGVQSNVHFHFANATIALSSLLAKYPGQVDCVSIQVTFAARFASRRLACCESDD
jgi:hypothetical protein